MLLAANNADPKWCWHIVWALPSRRADGERYRCLLEWRTRPSAAKASICYNGQLAKLILCLKSCAWKMYSYYPSVETFRNWLFDIMFNLFVNMFLVAPSNIKMASCLELAKVFSWLSLSMFVSVMRGFVIFGNTCQYLHINPWKYLHF